MGDRVRAVLGTAGVGLTVLGVLAVTNPALVAGTEPLASVAAALSDVGFRSLLLAGCVTVGLLLVRVAWGSSGGPQSGDGTDPAERFERLGVAPPERVTAETATPTAARLDAAIDRAIAGDDAALRGVRDRLGAATVDRLVRYAGYAPAAAEEAVATGTWTGDRVAAAFLSDERGPVYAFGSRLRLWIDPAAERRRRLSRTVGAIDALDGRPVADHPPADRQRRDRSQAEANPRRGDVR